MNRGAPTDSSQNRKPSQLRQLQPATSVPHPEAIGGARACPRGGIDGQTGARARAEPPRAAENSCCGIDFCARTRAPIDVIVYRRASRRVWILECAGENCGGWACAAERADRCAAAAALRLVFGGLRESLLGEWSFEAVLERLYGISGGVLETL